MNKKITIQFALIILLILQSFHVGAKNAIIDTLKQQIKSATNSKDSVQIYGMLCREYIDLNNVDSGMHYIQLLLNYFGNNPVFESEIGTTYLEWAKLEQAIGSKEQMRIAAETALSYFKDETSSVGKGYAFYYLAEYHMFINQWDSALHYFHLCYTSMPDSNLMMKAQGLQYLSEYYDHLGLKEHALEYLYDALLLVEKDGDKTTMANIYNTLSAYYLNVNDSLHNLFSEKSVKLFEEVQNYDFLVKSYLNRASSLYGKTDEGEEYLNKAWKTYHKSKIYSLQFDALFLYHFALNSFHKNQYDSCNYYLEKTLPLIDQLQWKSFEIASRFLLSRVQLQQNSYKASILSAIKVYKESKKSKDFEFQQKSLNHLSEIYKKAGLFKEAYTYFNLYIHRRDSAETLAINEKAIRKEIAIRYEKDILETKLENQSSKNAYLLAKQEATELRYGLFVVGLVIIGVIALFAHYYLRQRLKYRNNFLALQAKLLRTQMDPHFLSNSFLSMYHDVKINKNEIAADNLLLFSKLTRKILESSRESSISLEHEISLLKSYLQLHQNILSETFSFDIKHNEEIDPELTFLPPMICQPMIENAIEHGVKKVNHPCHIQLEFSEKNESLYIRLVNEAPKKKDQSKFKTQSYFHNILKERLDLIQKTYRKPVDFEMHTKNHESNSELVYIETICKIPFMGV